MGIEYSKARQLALRRAYPDAFTDEDEYDYEGMGMERPLFSMPGSPKFKTGMATPGDIGTLTEEVRILNLLEMNCSLLYHLFYSDARSQYE